MREIKFRAWDKSQVYMAYQGTPDLETFQSFVFHFGEDILMQFTGLKDKNGKEIYEGDICQRTEQLGVKYFKVRCQIVYKEDRFGLAWITKSFFNDSLFCHVEDLEVIGNIYENPELLS